MIRLSTIASLLIAGSALSAFGQSPASDSFTTTTTVTTVKGHHEANILTNAPAAQATETGSLLCCPKPDRNIFNHMSVGLTVGSTGIGLDLSTHITDWVRIRAGIDWMPKFSVPFNFSVMQYNDGAINSSNFSHLQEMMYDMTHIHVSEKVQMDGTPNFWNGKLLVDVYPWKDDRRWRVTAGFYVGSNKVAKAVNTLNEAPALLAINMFNAFRDAILTYDPMEVSIVEIPMFSFLGNLGIDPDAFYMNPEVAMKLTEYMESKGEMGIHVGDYIERDENGKIVPYMMKPGEDGKVQAWAFVNRFRPYLGFGFGSPIANRLNLDVDLGVMFWGGRPTIITHEGVDLVNDVENIAGRPGEYIDIMKKFTAYPVVSVRLSFDCF